MLVVSGLFPISVVIAAEIGNEFADSGAAGVAASAAGGTAPSHRRPGWRHRVPLTSQRHVLAPSQSRVREAGDFLVPIGDSAQFARRYDVFDPAEWLVAGPFPDFAENGVRRRGPVGSYYLCGRGQTRGLVG